MQNVGLERWLAVKSICCSSGKTVWFLAPTSGVSQTPVTLALGDPTCFSGLLGHPDTYSTHIHTQK